MSQFLRRLVDRSLQPATLHPRARLGAAWSATTVEMPDEPSAFPVPPDRAQVSPPAPQLSATPAAAITPRQSHDPSLRVPNRATAVPTPLLAPEKAAPSARATLPLRSAGLDRPAAPIERLDRAEPPATADARNSRAESAAAPAPLLPAQADQPRSERRTAAPPVATHAGRPEPGTAASAAPEVHIHIGRVELTALTQAAAAKPAPARSTPVTMSLQDYLRGRREAAP